MKPCITLFADASSSPERESAGWGAWWKGDERPSMTAGGPVDSWHKSMCVLELAALALAMETAEARRYFRASDALVLLQSDNLSALCALRQAHPAIQENRHAEGARTFPRSKKPCERICECTGRILAVADRQGVALSVRHVRGHKDGGGRNWVNRMCDSLAKEGRRAAERANAGGVA
ncbi:hypothetical protein L1787_12980 [Acuticoccus sp. M5D2P5]|uniref:RNase H family protein n=1 Tax=Acuticoccus kalidii TaxID=2910977 RepID=UPI001F3E6DB8|nr:RNase H family protein [Acuticoccus kalidii]MCF3934323.1 hypothetical protein [Acuticoccus kalidii]